MPNQYTFLKKHPKVAKLLRLDLVSAVWTSSMLRNSIYLMLATATLAGFGFFFWLISARIATPENVGLATTLVSIMNMIAILSLFGFDTALIRFLPQSKRRDESLNTSILLVTGAALLLSGAFLVLVPFISAQLSEVLVHPAYIVMFMAFSAMSAINILTDAIFLAYREVRYSLVIDIIFSIIKLGLPFLFAPWGAFGIFAAVAFAQSIGFVLSIAALMAKFDYHPKFKIDIEHIKSVWHYSAGNYLAGALNFLPATFLPIIITNYLGASHAAYFYIVMMIGNLLNVIPTSATRSLFAEGSHDTESVQAHMKKAIPVIVAILVPAILVVTLGGKFILSIFGTAYSSEGLGFLYLIAFSSVFIGIYSLYNSLFRINNNIRALVITNIVFASSIIGLSYELLPYGLVGVGVAWILGTILACVSSFLQYSGFQLIHRYARGFKAKVDDIIGHYSAIFQARNDYKKAIASGVLPRTLLTYPELPKTYHMLYMICPSLGIRITNDPSVPADIVMSFEDVTKRTLHPVLQKMRHTQKVLNADCNDISKLHVEKTFEQTFGYGMSVDPKTFTGVCVRKSDTNAVHDGMVIQCPTEPQAGYIYQKLVNNTIDEKTVYDIRVPVYNGTIPWVLRRYKDAHNRFDSSRAGELTEPEVEFSETEIKNIVSFCKKLGLDYGELDVLRDNDDGRVYIVDANNTPSYPTVGKNLSQARFDQIKKVLIDSFRSEIVDEKMR